MELFKALMLIFVGLAGLNILLSLVLWRATKFKTCLLIMLYWIIILINFFVQGAVAQKDPFYRILAFTPYIFLFHYCVVYILASLLNISLPIKKLWPIPPLSIFALLILGQMNVPPELYPMPFIIPHSFMYFYVVYQAVKNRRAQLTPSLWALCVLYVLLALHLYDYAYFYVRFEYFLFGFTLALMLLMAFAILIPSAIIEKISMEKARLETEMQYKATLVQAAKMGALGEMAGGVAHELNNPLAVLLINLESLADSSQQISQDPVVTSRLSRCLATVDRMSHIVKSLLLFSQEDKGGNRRLITVQELFRNTSALFSEKLISHQIELRVQIPNQVLQVNVYPAQISQVILHLVSNSIEAIEKVSTKWISLEVRDLGNAIEWTLRDSGVPPSPETQKKMFQPFFTTKEVGQGMGLGLSIAKGIVEAHGGHLFYELRDGATCFGFTLPKASEDPRSKSSLA